MAAEIPFIRLLPHVVPLLSFKPLCSCFMSSLWIDPLSPACVLTQSIYIISTPFLKLFSSMRASSKALGSCIISLLCDAQAYTKLMKSLPFLKIPLHRKKNPLQSKSSSHLFTNAYLNSISHSRLIPLCRLRSYSPHVPLPAHPHKPAALLQRPRRPR